MTVGNFPIIVRFLPNGYIAPHRVAHDLTDRQREILQILAFGKMALCEIFPTLSHPPSLRTLRDELYHLKRIGLVDTQGYGRGATWFLAQISKDEKK
jgi:ATP-dependent DNA helicase RecG